MGKRSGGGFFAKRQQQQQQVQAAAQQQEAQAGLLADAAFDKTVADTPVERLGEELIQPQPTQAPITELERGPSPDSYPLQNSQWLHNSSDLLRVEQR